MKVFALLSLLLPAVLNAQTLTYTGSSDEEGISDVRLFKTSSGTDTDIDLSSFDYSLFTDDDTSTGKKVGRFLEFGAEVSFGMPSGFNYLSIESFEIVLSTECNEPSDITGTYVDRYGVTQSIDISWSYVSGQSEATLSADIANNEPIEALGPVIVSGIDFLACEPESRVVEIYVTATYESTPEPSVNPTPAPTTTIAPSQSPTDYCDGEITWGDPHFWSWELHDAMFNYQGLGEHYIVYPCDSTQLSEWPFTVSSNYRRCYWQGDPKGCLEWVEIQLLTSPDPWSIRFGDYVTNKLNITVGSDLILTQSSIDADITEPGSNENNAAVIEYDDGNGRSGTVKIYYKGNEIVVKLEDVQYNGKPRRCEDPFNEGEHAYNEDCGDYFCDGLVAEMRVSWSWFWTTCIPCLRGELCGALGRYIRGDCTYAQAQNSANDCYYVWQTWDGQCYTPPDADYRYGLLHESWLVSNVDAGVASVGAGSCSSTTLKKMKPQTRNIDINDFVTEYPGDCNTSSTLVEDYTDTCYHNTFERFEYCCDQIGICDMLQAGCVYDLCSCTTGGENTVDDCLTDIILQSMNTTCSTEALYPTATPTSAPTKTPTGLVAGLPAGTSAEDLVFIMSAFVILFLLIAGGAYWYYRRKNKGKGYMDDDDQVQMGGSTPMNTGATYTED